MSDNNGEGGSGCLPRWLPPTNPKDVFVEQDCCFDHNGKHFCAGGAVVTPELCIAYLGDDRILQTWRGEKLGTYRITSSWRIASFVSSHMNQIVARVDGKTYQGRSAGEGMIFRGKRAACELKGAA